MSETVPFTGVPLSVQDCADEVGALRNQVFSGSWSCKLGTGTPLCIKSLFPGLKNKGMNAMIPGSSLKGMLRNMVEMLGAGCTRYYVWNPQKDKDDYPNLASCTPARACIACRLFGFVEGDFSWPGKVRIHDSSPAPAGWESYQVAFDREPHHEDKGPGWIVFPCIPFTETPAKAGEICVSRSQNFIFRLDYRNLNAEEYAVLKFALTLKDEYCNLQLLHMLGYAKSLGFGACLITIRDDKSPAIGAEINPYLKGLPFEELEHWRKVENLHAQ